MNSWVSQEGEKIWNKYRDSVNSKSGDSDELFPDIDYGKVYKDCTIIGISYDCQCPPNEDCGISYQIIEYVKNMKKSKSNSKSMTDTTSSEPLMQNDNQTQMPALQWSFESPASKLQKNNNGKQAISQPIIESNTPTTSVNTTPKIGRKRRKPFPPSPFLPNSNNHNTNNVNTNNNMCSIQWNAPSDINLARIEKSLNLSDKLSESSIDSACDPNESEAHHSDPNDSDQDEIDPNDSAPNESDPNESEEKDEHINVCISVVLQLKSGKVVIEEEMAHCHMRYFASLENNNGENVGSVLALKFYNESDELTYLTVHLESMQKFYNKLDKVGDNISVAIGSRGGNRAYFHPNPKSHLGKIYLRNHVLQQINMSSLMLQSVPNYGLVINKKGERFMSYQRNQMFNIDTAKTVSPESVGLLIDHARREQGMSSIEIESNYPKIVPNQVFEPLNNEGILLAKDLMSEENMVLFATQCAFSNYDMVKLFRAWGNIKPTVILLSQPGTGKSWLIALSASKYGISEFDPENPASCTFTMDDYTDVSLEDQGNEFYTMEIRCEDIDRKGNKCNGGGFETFVWKGSGYNKTKTRGGGDKKPMQSVKVGTMNTAPNNKSDGTLRRCFFWLYLKTANSHLYSNKSELMTASHKLSLELQQRSVYINTQKLPQSTVDDVCKTLHNMKETILSQYSNLSDYVINEKFETLTVLVGMSCIMSHALFRLSPNKVANVWWNKICEELKFCKDLKSMSLKELNCKFSRFDVSEIKEYVHFAFSAIHMSLDVSDDGMQSMVEKQKHFRAAEIMVLKSYTINKISSPCLCVLQSNENDLMHLFALVSTMIEKELLNDFGDTQKYKQYISGLSEWTEVVKLLHNSKILVIETGYKTRRITRDKVLKRYYVIPLTSKAIDSPQYKSYSHLSLNEVQCKAKSVKKNKNEPISRTPQTIEALDFQILCLDLTNKLFLRCRQLCEMETYIAYIQNNEYAFDLQLVMNRITNKEYDNEYVYFSDLMSRFGNILTFFENNVDMCKSLNESQRYFSLEFAKVCMTLQNIGNKQQNPKVIPKINGRGQRRI